MEFYKLERCSIGGSQGRLFTTQMTELYEDYAEFYQRYAGITYDCSDPEEPAFDVDQAKFEQKVTDVDQRVATIVCAAMDDCHTPESCYKLILLLGSLLDRPVVKEAFEKKYSVYTKLIESDFEHVKVREIIQNLIS